MASSRLVALHEPFDASKSQFASEKCRRDMSTYLTSLKNLELWAVRMYDASAKMPSGILSGNINQFGDYDECMQSVFDDNQQRIDPQYCLASLQPEITDRNPSLKNYLRLVQSNYMLTSNFDDPGHVLPRLSSINWAICVPSSCTYKDVEEVLTDLAANITNGIGIRVKVRVGKDMCQRLSHTISLGLKITIFIGVILLIICTISTIYDFKTEDQYPWFVVFSLRKNIRSLISLERVPDDIQSIHGIRFLFMVLLYNAHKLYVALHAPYINRVNISEVYGQSWTLLGRTLFLYSDPFLMMSGLLATYKFVGYLQKGNGIRIKQEYMSRYLRVVPPILVAMYFTLFIGHYYGTGPLRNLHVTHHFEICKTHWWKNLLFIQNFFGMENICYAQTHYIATDTQLFVLIPFMSLLLWKYPKAGAVSLFGIAGISTIGRYLITFHMKLNYFCHYGQSLQTFFDSFNYMYMIPSYRITVTIMGVLVGYLLRTKKEFKFTQGQLKIGWFVNTVLLMAVLLGTASMTNNDYKYSPTGAAQYAAFAPIALCSFFGWVIFTSHLGYDTALSRFFSWRGFLISTRLSYAIYLQQIPVFILNITEVRHSGYFSFATVFMNIYEMLQVMIQSILLTILVEIPCGNIIKIVFPQPKVKRPFSKEE